MLKLQLLKGFVFKCVKTTNVKSCVKTEYIKTEYVKSKSVITKYVLKLNVLKLDVLKSFNTMPLNICSFNTF